MQKSEGRVSRPRELMSTWRTRRKKPPSSATRATIAITIFNVVVVVGVVVLSRAKPNLASPSPSSSPSSELPPLFPASDAYRILSLEPRRRLKSLAKLTDDDGSEGGQQLTRPFLGRAHSLAAEEIARWFADAGLERVEIDAVGNVRGRWSAGEEEDEGEEVLLIGSHYDTVRNAGAFDGALGIVAAVAAVKAAEARRRVAAVAAGNRSKQRRAVELVAFSDEEGLRFGTTFLGSSALAGTLLPSGVLDAAVDDRGVALRAALLELKAKRGEKTAPTSLEEDIAACALSYDSSSSRRYRGYVEAHMEQGPTLESQGARLSVVSSISGQTRVLVKVLGAAGHAGTVPMGKSKRRDAAAGAAEVVVEVERICEEMSGVVGSSLLSSSASASWLFAPVARVVRAVVGEEDSSASRLIRRLFSPLRPVFDKLFASFPNYPDHLVCTVGKISVSPNAPNVVAGEAELVVDVRSSSDDAKRAALSAIDRAVSRICLKRFLHCSAEVVHEAKGSVADAALASAVEGAARRSEALFSEMARYREAKRGEIDDDFDSDASTTATTQIHVARARASGAGHDALALSSPSSSTSPSLPWAMLFVRDVGGVSHSPLEKVRGEDVAAACAALHELVVEHVGL